MQNKMKSIKYLIMAAVCGMFASCMDGGYGDPTDYVPGNQTISEATGVVTIAQLKTAHANAISSGSYDSITTDVKIKATVVGNDVGGNMYKQICVQDATGGIIVAINDAGINGYLPIGQEIIIDLKGLVVGGYGKQPQIGTPYTNSKGAEGVGRMPKYVWEQHYKAVGTADESKVDTVDFKTIENNMDACGQLVVLKNVTFVNADGTKTLKDGEESGSGTGYYKQTFNEFGTNVFTRTSGDYAKFSSTVMPYDTVAHKAKACDVVGIATRYNDDWQIIIRKQSDIKEASGIEPSTSYSVDFTQGQGDWTITDNTPEGATVWTNTTTYGMKATGYINKTNTETSSWLVSPSIDMSKMSKPTLTINQALNFFTDVATAQNEATVWASTNGKDWKQVNLEGYPTTLSWTFFSSTASLADYAGQKIQLAFHYSSTATKAGTWEIKTVEIK
jgi:hypothetical protein